MAYFPELDTTTPIASAPYVRAVGWLSSEHPFPIGSVRAEFLPKLREMCACWDAGISVLRWPIAAGPHTCEMCGKFTASGNLGVPGDGLLYVAPEMIAHYVEEHSYLPPSEFVEAVMRSPLPGTKEYREAVRSII